MASGSNGFALRRFILCALLLPALLLVAACNNDSADRISAGSSQAGSILDLPVSFSAVNRNQTLVLCSSDGQTYSISGHIVGPAAALSGATSPAATLYLHGLGFAGFFWQFKAVEGYDYAMEMAKLGHVSVVIDRLGHGASVLANGNDTCIGAQADMANQMIEALKAGGYTRTDGGSPVRFEQIALAGHSAGGAIAEVAAYSFGGSDALLVLDWLDLPLSLLSVQAFGDSTLACLNSPDGYAYFGQTDADFQQAMLHDSDPATAAAVTAMRVKDPCGDLMSVATALVLNQLGTAQIKGSVLLVCADNDALFPPLLACDLQGPRYLSASDVSTIRLPNTGHAVTVERSAPMLREQVSAWLKARGF